MQYPDYQIENNELSDKLSPKEWELIPPFSRSYLDWAYQSIPNEGYYHTLRHTFEVVQAGHFAVTDPVLFDLFGFEGSIQNYNNQYKTTSVDGKRVQIQTPSILRAIDRIACNYLINDRDDLYYCLMYGLSMHDSVLWEDGDLVEEGAEDKSKQMSNYVLTSIYYDSSNPLRSELNDISYDKLTEFAGRLIPLTNPRGRNLQLNHLSKRDLYPFAKEVKTIDLLGSYLGKSVEQVYDLLLALSNEKLTRPNEDQEDDPSTLSLEMLFNFPRRFVCSQNVYGGEIGNKILNRYAELGFPLAGPIIIPEEVNALVQEIVEKTDLRHERLSLAEKKHLTWNQIQIVLGDEKIRNIILGANKPLVSELSTDAN